MLGLILMALVGAGVSATLLEGDEDDDRTSSEREMDQEGAEEDPLMTIEGILLSNELDDEMHDDSDVHLDPLGGAFDSDDEEDLSGEDVGVTIFFDEETNSISLDVGEDETSRLAIVRHEIEGHVGDPCCSSSTSYTLNFYLVPEGLDFPPTAAEVLDDNPELEDYAYNLPGGIVLDTDLYLEHMGATLVGSEYLGEFSSSEGPDGTPGHVANSVNYGLVLNVNAEFDSYFVTSDNFDAASTGGLQEIGPDDTLVPSPEHGQALVTLENDVDGVTTELHPFYSEVMGSSADDELIIENGGPDLTLIGGEGNDTLDVGSSDSFVKGGEGDDVIVIGDYYSGIAEGGAGDDTFYVHSRFSSGEYEGGEGADRFVWQAYNVNEYSTHFTITDFEHGVDQIVVELGDKFQDQWTLNTTDDGHIVVSFIDRGDEPGYEDLLIRAARGADLAVEDVVIVERWQNSG